MDDKKKFSLPIFLKLVLDVLILGGMIIYIYSMASSIIDTPNLWKLNIIISYLLYLAGGISIFGILFKLREIIKSLIKRTPFIWSNVKSLKMISVFCFIIAGTYIINFFVNGQYMDFEFIAIDLSGVHTDFEFIIFLFAGCFIFVLSQVFKQAVEYKEENDLTI